MSFRIHQNVESQNFNIETRSNSQCCIRKDEGRGGFRHLCKEARGYFVDLIAIPSEEVNTCLVDEQEHGSQVCTRKNTRQAEIVCMPVSI